jgi:hypothetical protein
MEVSETAETNKWKVLRSHWRFGLWALFTSTGSIMTGFDLLAGQQCLAIVRLACDNANQRPLSSRDMAFHTLLSPVDIFSPLSGKAHGLAVLLLALGLAAYSRDGS